MAKKGEDEERAKAQGRRVAQSSLRSSLAEQNSEMRANVLRSREEMRAYAKKQELEAAQHDLAEAEKASKRQQRLHDERREREHQIRKNKESRDSSKRNKREMEQREMAAVRAAIDKEEQFRLDKIAAEKRRFEAIIQENNAEKLRRDDAKRRTAEDDNRLMEAAKARLEAEEQARVNAFADRQARLAHFSRASAEDGAGKAEAETIAREMERVNREAALKVAADERRERNDLDKIESNKKLMAQANSRLKSERDARTAKMHKDNMAYAAKVKADLHVAEEQERGKGAKVRADELENRRHLDRQIAYDQHRRATEATDMTPLELKLNRKLLVESGLA